jgi:hypothetical protein
VVDVVLRDELLGGVEVPLSVHAAEALDDDVCGSGHGASHPRAAGQSAMAAA